MCAVELPGRGTRIHEPPYRRLTPLVRALASSLEPYLDRPFAIFGHSMGGLLGFELARTLRDRGQPQPAHLFVSGMSVPGAARTRPAIHGAPDEDVKRELRVLGGTPRELLDDDELMSLMLPTLRADFSVLETYEHRPGPPLAVPITVFGGLSDPAVPSAGLPGWRAQPVLGARVHLFPGGHFFLHAAAGAVVRSVASALEQALPVSGRAPAGTAEQR